MNNYNLIIVGTGDLAREAFDLNSDINEITGNGFKVKGFLGIEKNITKIFNIKVYNDIFEIDNLNTCKFCIAIANNRVRHDLVKKLNLNSEKFASLIHPNTVIRKSSFVENGCIIFPYVALGIESRIKSHTIINTSSNIGHHSIIGEFSNISPGACISGKVQIEEGVLIGSNSVIHQGLNIGGWSVIAANSYLTRSLKSGKIYSSKPGKVIGDK